MKKSNTTITLVLVLILSVCAGIFVYQPLWEKISSFRNWNLGLDLAGGSYLTYEIDLNGVSSEDGDYVIKGLRDVIEKRVNLFGVSEPKVYLENAAGVNRLVVELAGIKDVNRAIMEIGETPFLDFREVGESSDDKDSVTFIPTNLNGRYVKNAELILNRVTGKPEVAIEFNGEGADIFASLTERNVGRRLCIFLDGKIESFESDCPVVQEKISGGKAQISGSFTIDEAKKMIERFNAGALPAPIKLVNQQTVSADFGRDSLDKAIYAGLLGTLLIMIFMIFYYRLFGVFSSVALLMYVALTLAVFKLVPVTMTLAGIAGFILSVGMAVDANILVFERVKEELKKGLSKQAAIEEGFKRAWTSIRDSNISTIITSAVLYYFTSSFVRGFALTLLIGVLVSMFSAITITRTLLRIFTKERVKKES